MCAQDRPGWRDTSELFSLASQDTQKHPIYWCHVLYSVHLCDKLRVLGNISLIEMCARYVIDNTF